MAPRKPAARSRRKKSTTEPKRIINRKKGTRKGTGTARAANRDAAREKAAKAALVKDSRDTAKVERLLGKGKTVREVAEATGLTPGRVRKLHRNAGISPKSRIVGTDTEVAKQIVKLREEGTPWPEIRARTGMSGAKIRQLAEAAGGSTNGRAKKKTAAKPTRKKATARKAAGAKGKAKPKAARTRRTKAKATVQEEAAPSGRPQGRRARRASLATFLDEVVHDLDSDNDEVAEGLVGHTIQVTRDFNGHAVRPTEHKVVKVKSVVLHDTEGRVIEYVDDNMQTRFVSSREITSLK